MKVLVTGGAGFIGSHLVDELISRGADVHIVDNFCTGFRENVNAKAHLHLIDIMDKKAVISLIAQIRPEVVYHLAAQVDVQRSVSEAEYDAAVNILGTIHLLDACRYEAVRKIIFSSSCAVYGNTQMNPVIETEKLLPISNYGLSKLAAEGYLRVYSQLYGLTYTILRYSNVYGPRQTPKGEGGVVSIFLERMKTGLPLVIFGDGNQTRDFIYVKDVVLANLAAIEHGDNETVHISSSNQTTINALASLFTNIHGQQVTTLYKPDRQGDIRHSCLSNAKAAEFLRWHPMFTLKSGLIETYSNYSESCAF